MSFTVNNSVNNTVTSNLSCAVSISISSGHTVGVLIYSDGPSSFTVADSSGTNTYTPRNSLTAVFGQFSQAFTAVAVGSALTSVTATSNAAGSFISVTVFDLTATGAISYADSGGTDWNFNNPATTDGTTSPSLSIGAASSGLLLAQCQDPAGGTVSTGTGFTAGPTNFAGGVSEYKAVSASSAATFTDTPANQRPQVMALLFTEASAAPPSTTAWQPIKPLNPPGASPGKFGRFYQSPKAYNAAANVTAALTGQSATFAGGTATPTVSAALTGQAGTFATGALTPNSSIGLAGQAATFAAGTIIPNTAVSLTGQTASFSAGLLSPSGSLGLSGQSATFSAGTLTPNTSVAVTGKVATFGAGTMTTGNDVTVSLTGQAAAFTAGILAPSTTLVLSGGASSFAAGNLLATPTLGLGGQSGTFSAGTLSPAFSAPIQGLQASFTGGVLGVVGDVTVALSGQSATFTAGTVSVPQSQTNDAGRRIRNIYRVTIDGQVFEFRTLQEALKLLDQAKELAAKVAEDQEIWQQTPKPPPEIKVSSRELRKAAAETKREIKATYERAALHAELRMLLELSRRREEDETLLLLM